jgi:hypothetical protein
VAVTFDPNYQLRCVGGAFARSTRDIKSQSIDHIPLIRLSPLTDDAPALVLVKIKGPQSGLFGDVPDRRRTGQGFRAVRPVRFPLPLNGVICPVFVPNRHLSCWNNG